MTDEERPIADLADGETLESPTRARRAAGGPTGAPERLGHYRLERLLGRGGMGEVWAAWDERLERRVAVKRIAAPRRGVAEVRARFWREARALAALDHPGVVRVHDMGEEADGSLFMAMELVEGTSLEDALEAPWTTRDAKRVLLDVARALGAAHAAGLTHRDVKPSNVLLEAAGRARVVDFGLARRADADEERVTADGAVVGTPAWMAPEQVRGEPVGPPADVFAVGVLAYRLLTGVHPFARETTAGTVAAISAGLRRPLGEAAPGLPSPWVAVVERCLAPHPQDRWGDGDALAAAVEPLPEADDAPALAPSTSAPPPSALDSELRRGWTGRPAGSRRGRRWGWALAAAAALALVASVGLLAPGPPGPTPPRPLGPGALAEAPSPPASPTLAQQLPPRPVVAVLAFEPSGDGSDADLTAAVLADALRGFLALDPMRLVASPASVLDGALPPDRPRTAAAAAAALTRPGRALGHVDAFVEGVLHLDADGAVTAEVHVFDPARGRPLLTRRYPGRRDAPAALARTIAQDLLPLLGARLPADAAPPTRSPEAWAALLDARRARRTDDQARATEALARALRLDPAFVTARIERLELLRVTQDRAALAAEARALLDEASLGARDRAMAQAWLALGEGRPTDAVAGLTDLLDLWPHDLEALEMLLTVRFGEPEIADLAEAEALARRLLALAPRHEGAASRLIRALAFRGRADQAPALLAELGVPLDEPSYGELPAELALYAGRWDDALAAFDRHLAHTPGQPYSENLRLSTLILAGRCDEAAVEALARVTAIEERGRGTYLDWTYSLAVQALTCRQQWDAARQTLDRWADRRPSGRRQATFFRPRLELAAGRSPDEVADALRVQLEAADTPADVRLDLLLVYALAETRPDRLLVAAGAAEGASMDLGVSRLERDAYHQLARALAARARLLAFPDSRAPDALPALDAAVPPPEWPRSETMLIYRTDLMALRADTLTRLGARAGPSDAARAAWTEIAALGYARLWRTDLWVLAGRHR